MASTSTKQKERTAIAAKEPNNFKVVILNDDVTPMEFVVNMLVRIFNHTPDTANKLMMTIHTEDSAVAGIYTYEIAEQKAIDATLLARENSFPLVLKVVEDV